MRRKLRSSGRALKMITRLLEQWMSKTRAIRTHDQSAQAFHLSPAPMQCTPLPQRQIYRRTRSIAHARPRYATSAFVAAPTQRSEEHTSEIQSLLRISYAALCLNKKTK